MSQMRSLLQHGKVDEITKLVLARFAVEPRDAVCVMLDDTIVERIVGGDEDTSALVGDDSFVSDPVFAEIVRVVVQAVCARWVEIEKQRLKQD